MSTILRLALVATLFYHVHAVCPSGFNLVRNGDCHRQVLDAYEIDASEAPLVAKAECRQYDAQPVIIRNQEDHDFWLSVAKNNHELGSNHGFIVLGLECNSSMQWMWADRSSIDFKPEDYSEEVDGTCERGCMWTMDPTAGTWTEACHKRQSIDLYCVIAGVPFEADDADCTNFSNDADDDLCYQVGAYTSNWTQANTICHSFGATLASVHNERENNFIRRLSLAKGLLSGTLLGAKLNSSKAFEWTDGTAWDYEYFADGYPQDDRGECIIMDTYNIEGKWRNEDCSLERHFACVRPTNAKLPTCDGVLHEEGDIIYSPGFPSSASEPCEFVLKVKRGMLVEVEVLLLEANECCDHLELIEGELGTKIIADLSGYQRTGAKFRTVSDNVMRASWKPQGGVNVRGMMITFRGVPKQ